MIDEELQLNNWKEVLDYRVRTLRRSIAAERGVLISRGASDEQVADALRHQHEILNNILSVGYAELLLKLKKHKTGLR